MIWHWFLYQSAHIIDISLAIVVGKNPYNYAAVPIN